MCLRKLSISRKQIGKKKKMPFLFVSSCEQNGEQHDHTAIFAMTAGGTIAATMAFGSHDGIVRWW
jgi:hypothetical protein